MFGAYYFGQPYFGEAPAISVGTTDTRDNCGGMFGTATFGQPYFGGHNECNVFEPLPPVIPPVVVPVGPPGGGGGGGTTGGRYIHQRMPDLSEQRQRTAEEWEKSQIEADDEEILLILSLWMGLK